MDRDEFLARVCAAFEVPESVVREMIEAERPAREAAEAEREAFIAWARRKAEEANRELERALLERS